MNLSDNFLETVDTMPQKDWICDDQQDPETWRIWMYDFSLSVIFHSPDARIRDCYDLSRVVSLFAKRLFNYAF